MELTEHRETFTGSYIETALMDTGDRCGVAVDCDQDCNGGHADVGLSLSDLHPDTLRVLTEDAQTFFDAHAADLAKFPGNHRYTPDDWAEVGGYYFWMSRAGHGTGFLDWYTPGGLDAETSAARDRLAAACRTEGERDLFYSTDGKITHGKSWGEHQRERNGS